MYAIVHLDLHAARSRELQQAASSHALAGPLRQLIWRRRAAAIPEGVRRAIGFRLVEAGLRLVVLDGAHPPSEPRPGVRLARR